MDRGVRAPAWMGYLSTTGVYGDRQGGWVFEDSALLPLSPEARRRVEAEHGWAALALGEEPRALPADVTQPDRNAL